MAKTKEQLLNILDQFQLDEKVVSAEPFGNGHINDTLKVTNEKGEIKYVLQRINHLIFKATHPPRFYRILFERKGKSSLRIP